MVHSFMFVCLFDGVSAAFNNISVISLHSVLLVEDTGRPGENHCKSLTNFRCLLVCLFDGT